MHPPSHLDKPARPVAPRSRRPATNARRSQAEACAGAVLDVVPAVMDALRAAMRRHVGEQLSVPQFRCLNFIAAQPGCGVGAVAAFLGVTMPTASAMVGRLVQAGAVAPRDDPGDGRRTRLLLTAAGRAQLEQIRRAARDDLATALLRHDAAELHALQQGLLSLQRAFEPSDVT
jgi:DNA-binding MarR family transcriptional regulator